MERSGQATFERTHGNAHAVDVDSVAELNSGSGDRTRRSGLNYLSPAMVQVGRTPYAVMSLSVGLLNALSAQTDRETDRQQRQCFLQLLSLAPLSPFLYPFRLQIG